MADTQSDTKLMDARAARALADKNETEGLIEEFRPYLRGCAARYTTKANDNFDDMYSAAMMAFYEAIQNYDSGKGHFFPFADGVVRRRLIDCVRKVYNKTVDTVPIDDPEEASTQAAAVVSVSVQAYEAGMRQRELVAELEQFRNELAVWGITMETLASQSPRHARVRELYRTVINAVLDAPDIIQIIQVKRYFPVKKVSDLTGIPQKKLERARTYILASLIIQLGDYEYLAEYIKGGRQ